jgi:hypothetical protein
VIITETRRPPTSSQRAIANDVTERRHVLEAEDVELAGQVSLTAPLTYLRELGQSAIGGQ